MTTLDRAFIKAFSADGAPQEAAERADSEPVASDAPELIKPDEPPRAEAAAPPPEPREDRREADADEAEALPLSAFAPPPQVHDSCRAMLEIDRAEWPAAAGELLSRAARQWDRFTEQIIERTAQGQKCIAIASGERGAGRTTVALALAKHAAGRGLRVVVVDADLENPALVRSCSVSARTGWDDLVASELPLGEALISVIEDGVTLLPWRGEAVPIAELARSMRTSGIFGTLREHYDLVVLDTMPLLGNTTIADFRGFAVAIHLDAVYLVQNVRTTPREELVAVSARLRRAGLPLGGVIENFVSPTGSDEPGGANRPPAAGRPLVVHG